MRNTIFTVLLFVLAGCISSEQETGSSALVNDGQSNQDVVSFATSYLIKMALAAKRPQDFKEEILIDKNGKYFGATAPFRIHSLTDAEEEEIKLAITYLHEGKYSHDNMTGIFKEITGALDLEFDEEFIDQTESFVLKIGDEEGIGIIGTGLYHRTNGKWKIHEMPDITNLTTTH